MCFACNSSHNLRMILYDYESSKLMICYVVVPVFGSTKRGLTHETPLLQAVVRFFSLLREWTVLSAAIALVARLHNVLRDEPSLELICEYTALWPSVVSKSVLCISTFTF